MVFNWWKKREPRAEQADTVSTATPSSVSPGASHELERTAASDLCEADRPESVVTELPGQLELSHEKIAARAYEIWVRKGSRPGTGVQDWLEAEAELRAELQGRADEPLPKRSR